MLEAAACECIIITTATCAIPEYIENEKNGLCTNNIDQMREYLIEVLKNPNKYEYLGKNARKTIIDNFSVEKFVSNWNNVFDKILEIKK